MKKDDSNIIEFQGLQFPALLRLKFERHLDNPAGRFAGLTFQELFRKKLEIYRSLVCRAINRTLDSELFATWLETNGVELITWHYKTRHPAEAAFEEEWFSAQVALLPTLKGHVERGDLLPYKSSESPYIEIFAKEQGAEEVPLIYIDLPSTPSGSAGIGVPPRLEVPPNIMEYLSSPSMQSDENPSTADLTALESLSPGFLLIVKKWMKRVGGGEVSDLEALKNLQASLKVTLILLSNKKYHCHLPRSVFLCPAYVGGEKVGGMAFTCKGRVSLGIAMIVESVATSLLTYLRLREDALAHVIIAEMNEIDQAKRFFMHRLTHDFRHPIDALRSTVREVGALLESVDGQLGHMEDVMNKTLLAIEGDSTASLLRPKKRLDRVSEFIADISFYFRRQYEERGKSLSVASIDKDWTFHVDRGMLREVLENLVANSLEHGGSHSELKVDFLKGKLYIHVQDNGTGISATDRAKIFFPFYLRPLQDKRDGGTLRGRGLAISKMLMEAQGGSISFKGTDGNYYTSSGNKIEAPPFSVSAWISDFVVEIDQGKTTKERK